MQHLNKSFELKEKFFPITLWNIIFIIVLGAILSSNVIFYFQLEKFINANQMVVHTYQVIQDADKIFSNLHAAESKTRAYLLTDDETMLQAADAYKKKVFEAYSETKSLTMGNPKQQKNLVNLLPLLQDRLNLLSQAVKLKEGGKNENPAEINQLIRKGEITDIQIEQSLRTIIDVENFLLFSRNDDVFHKITLLSFMLIAGSGINLLVLGLILLLFNIQLRKRITSDLAKTKSETLLRGIIDGAKDSIAACDVNFNIIAINHACIEEFRRMYGRHLSLGCNIKNILAHLPSQQEKITELWTRALKGEEFSTFIAMGETHLEVNNYELSFSGIYNPYDQLIGSFFIAKNINKRMEEEAAIRASKAELENAYHSLKENENKLSLLNQMNTALQSAITLEESLKILSNFLEKLLPGFSGYLFLKNDNNYLFELRAQWGKRKVDNSPLVPETCWGLRQGKIHVYHENKKEFFCQHLEQEGALTFSLCLPLVAGNGNIGLLCIINNEEMFGDQDIPQLSDKYTLFISSIAGQIATLIYNMQLHESMKIRSIRDQLTGFYNRFYLEDAFERELQRAQRQQVSLGIVFMDIDYFKNINDTYGHSVGDQIISQLSQKLVSEVRGTDMFFRYGGEEFLIILHGVNEEHTSDVIEQLKIKISNMVFQGEGQTIKGITASFGIAMFPNDSLSKTGLIAAADKALYHAKNTGRNKVVCYQEVKEFDFDSI